MPTSEFQFLGVPHIIALVLTIVLPIALSVLVKATNSSVITKAVCYLLAATLIVNEVGHWVYRAATVQSVNDFVQSYLPLHMCGVTVFIVIFTLLRRNQSLYEIAYFWGIVATLNAVLTPQLEGRFSALPFFFNILLYTAALSPVCCL